MFFSLTATINFIVCLKGKRREDFFLVEVIPAALSSQRISKTDLPELNLRPIIGILAQVKEEETISSS